MDSMSKTGKKGLIFTTWERCKSLGRGRRGDSPPQPSAGIRGRSRRVAPEGCFTVYVGPEKQRFVIRTEYANHPLFRILLEEAAAEYGYNSQAPLALPCDVQIFYRVLTEMDDGDADGRRGCGYPKRLGSYHLLSPPRPLAVDQFDF